MLTTIRRVAEDVSRTRAKTTVEFNGVYAFDKSQFTGEREASFIDLHRIKTVKFRPHQISDF